MRTRAPSPRRREGGRAAVGGASGRGPVGSGRRLAGRRRPRRAAAQRQGARVRLDRRQRDRDAIPCRTTRARRCGIPRRASQTPVNVDTGFNVFCSGLAHLVDGRLFLAGGNKDQQLNGIVQTHLFDPATNTWSLGPNMAAGRWYPTVTPLRNGEMLITSGRVDTPEVRTLERRAAHAEHGVAEPAAVSVDGRRAERPGVLLRPRPDAARARHDRHRHMADARAARLDQPRLRRPRALRRRQDARRRRRSRRRRTRGSSTSTGRRRRSSPTAPMAYGRRQHNLTVLADGTVLATGGQLLRRLARRPQRRRLPGRAVESRHRPVADAGGDADHAPIPLDRAAAARRARPVLRRRDLRHVRPGRLSGQERRDLLAAVPLPGRRHARAAPGHRRRAGVHELRRGDGDRDRRTRRRSARSPSSGSAPSRTRTTWSSATSRWPSPPARRA